MEDQNQPTEQQPSPREQQVNISVSNSGLVVRLDFGVPVQWIDLPPDVAEQVGAFLIQNARAARAKSGPRIVLPN